MSASDGPAWTVERSTGSALDFHARPVPAGAGRLVWPLTVDRPALVLGSTQDAAVVDRRATDAAGVEVVRRRSGGGAVLLDPDRSVWVDVVLPAGDPLWEQDVGRAFLWLGQAWARALTRLGLAADVHSGALRSSRWSGLVCFAGLGPGEASVSGRKAVGLSQHRTRSQARFQCVVHRRWEPDRLLGLLALESADRVAAAAALSGSVAEVVRPAEAIEAALVTALSQA
ncbi:MAG: hypothetical protein WKF43_11200 [Acidimicrobiales bacterium]